jgi:transcriptional regulator with XRE-family HTH domain
VARKPLDGSPEAEVGRRINDLRKKAGLTNEDLAARLGISEAGVKKLYNGESTQAFVRLRSLAEILKCTPNEVVGVKSSGERAHELLQAVLEVTYRALGLSERQAQVLAEIAQEVLQAPPLTSAALDPQTAARVQTELAVRQFLQSKPS